MCVGHEIAESIDSIRRFRRKTEVMMNGKKSKRIRAETKVKLTDLDEIQQSPNDVLARLTDDSQTTNCAIFVERAADLSQGAPETCPH